MTSLIKHILDQSEALGNKPAFIHDKDGKTHTLSYLDFRRLVLAFSKAIQKEDIPYKSRVLLLGENSPKWPAAYLGAHLCGLTVIHADVRFTKTDLERILEFTDPSLILCDKSFAKYFKKAPKKIFLDDVYPLHQDLVPRIIPLAPDQAMSIILTSGTTGSPKGVMLNESNFMSNIRMFESMKGFVSSRDRLVAILPLHHVYPFTCSVLAPLYIGATLIYPQSLKGEDIFGAIKNHGGTILIAIPRVLELFCNRIFDRVAQLPTMKRCIFYTLYSLAGSIFPSRIKAGKLFFRTIHGNFPYFRFFACGGAALDPDVHKRLGKLGFRIIEAYGLSETSPIAAINDLKKQVSGSVGRPAPGVEIKIEKNDPFLENGEICIKGPNVMMGYYKRPDLTEKVIIDGWFHSGDLGYLDRHGHLFITGRKDEMIVLSNGKNIYPEELEKHYGQNEKIKELGIVLLKEAGKEFLTAVVFPNKAFFMQHKNVNIYQDIKFDIETEAHRLPPYKRVSRIELFDEEFPKTALGKLKRYKILELLKKRSVRSDTTGRSIRPEDQDPFLVFTKEFLKLKKFPSFRANLETDIGLDSLSKIEFFSAIEKRYNTKISEESASGILTLEDIKRLLADKAQGERAFDETRLEDEILIPPDPPLGKHVSAINHPLTTLVRFCFYLSCKIFIKIVFNAGLAGKENLRDLEPPFIIAPNHVSFIDALVLYGLLPFRIINQSFFISIPLYFGVFPLSLIRKIGRIILTGSWDTAVRSLQYSYQVLKEKKIMCVFPEGSRSIDGNIKTPKKGIGYVAQKSNAFFVPTYIEGSNALYSRKNPGFHRARIMVHIFPPIYPEGGVDDLLHRWQALLQDFHNRGLIG